VELSAGKLRNLTKLADENGRFKMMAIDQRGSLERLLSKVLNCDPKEVPYEAMARTKEVITRVLSPHATAVLTDPLFGYPYSVSHFPRDCALLLCSEATGYDKAGPEGRERKSRLEEGWSVAKARRAGADAIKLLVYYTPEASDDTREHQHRLVCDLGEECARYDLPFLLELVSYPIYEPGPDTPEFARKKPKLVEESAREFSRPVYRVDILKLEFPAELKYCYEFSRKAFDSREREPVYDLKEVEGFCKAVDEASRLPWVILSAGVDIEEFLKNVELATTAGASGFLCGRAIWKDVVSLYPDIAAMEAYLHTEGVYNFLRANAACERAVPWFNRHPFTGRDSVRLAGQTADWYKEY